MDTAFEELRSTDPARSKRFLEVGSGVGNAFMPLMVANPGLDGVAIDISNVAIELLKEREDFRQVVAEAAAEAAPGGGGGKSSSGRPARVCAAHVCDITQHELPPEAAGEGFDLVLLLFCLSAISPEKMRQAVQRLARSLKPGGMLMFRDYGRYDAAQLRFSKGHRLSEHFYVKQDGTRVYYFTLEGVRRLMCQGRHVDDDNDLPTGAATLDPEQRGGRCPGGGGGSGAAGGGAVPEDHATPVCLEEVECEYIRRQYANRGQQQARFRVWVHGKFRRPLI